MTKAMFAGERFARVFPRVWRLADHEMTQADWLLAGRLTLPEQARLTGLTAIRRLGLDFGPLFPLHFVIEGDLHIDLDDVFLHRTKKLAHHDNVAVTNSAAYLFYCSHARVIDAIKVGDWMLYGEHMSVDEVRALGLSALWRDGAHEAIWILDHLDGRSRSLKESETRAILDFAGLPRPDVNVVLDLGPDEPVVAIADLLIRECGLVVEYEGAHHQEERLQYSSDISRYELFRRHDIPYLQVTSERLGQPRKLALSVHRAMVELGYDGPAPLFTERWRQLFRPIREVLGSRDEWLKAWARGAVG
ncbi:MAG TPA: hypothetical protein VFO49_19065 [Nocardioides sp.]|nr:hypothetical protein [Nocardioides sp.]